MGWHNQCDRLFAIAYGNRFFGVNHKNWHVNLHCVCWKNHNISAYVNTAIDLSTSDKNVVNIGPVTPEFCSRLCAN